MIGPSRRAARRSAPTAGYAPASLREALRAGLNPNSEVEQVVPVPVLLLVLENSRYLTGTLIERSSAGRFGPSFDAGSQQIEHEHDDEHDSLTSQSGPKICERCRLSALLLLLLWLPVCEAQPTSEDTFTIARKKMVEEQLAGPGRDIKNSRVLQAMSTVPRHEFVPKDLRKFAYFDEPLPIGYGQTISQPFIVAFMTEQLDPKPSDRVLEIGTGSGYQAAVLSLLVSEVYTIEIIEPLAKRAEADLNRLGYTNVKVRAGDGYLGWPDQAPFDAIIVTCAPENIPSPLVAQLRDGGRMIIPVGGYDNQQLYLLQKRGTNIEQKAVLPVRFVPMTRAE
jgi:protein-L-isoaspartate(D-aspartate) O-methyltransferase